jgi:hypothetical protein
VRPLHIPESSGLDSITNCSGLCTTGNEECSTPFHRLKIVVFAPMPRARESIATAVNPGDFRNARSA